METSESCKKSKSQVRKKVRKTEWQNFILL